MLKIDNFVTPSAEQWMFVINGMRNPKNSWDRIDSFIENNGVESNFFLGINDEKLGMTLAKGGPVHAKYRRQLPVHVKITAPLYWWKEFETYRTGVCPNPTDIEINSCSTMHKIHSKEFTEEDFSHEHLVSKSCDSLAEIINILNYYRDLFFETKDKKYWWQMIQLLPSSYNQTRSVSMNYEVLSNMYEWRHNHKLDEWIDFCHWIEELPYSTLIVGDLSVSLE